MAKNEVLTESDDNDDLLDNESQEELVIVEDNPDDGDDVVARNDDHEDGHDDERAAIRERRRKEKQERKQRKEQAITRDKLELDFLRKRNEDLERRVSTQEMRAHHADLQNIDAQYAQAQREMQMAESVIAKAVSAGNGEDVAQVDDMVMHYAKEFMDDNPWYNINGDDEASAVVLAIDKSLAREGLDPKSEDYWDELRARVAKRLPDKVGKAARKTRGGPSIGSGREHAPTSTRKEIYISPDRKQALVEAGVWDDSVLRMKYVKRYAEYDRNNR